MDAWFGCAHREGVVLKRQPGQGRCWRRSKTASFLSGGMVSVAGSLRGFGARGMRGAEMSSFQEGRRGGFFGGGSLGLGGGMNNPSLLLTAPLLEGGSGQTAPPAPGVFSDSGVQQAFQTLQTDVKNDVSSATRPTHASVGALQDDLAAIRKGTLSGTAASTKIQADQAANPRQHGPHAGPDHADPVRSAGAPDGDHRGERRHEHARTTGTTSTAGATTTNSGAPPAPSSAVQSALETLQTDLKNDTTSNAAPSHAAIGTVQDDLDAIRKGTLTGTAAVSQVQTDAAAVLTSMGLTSAQVSQVQADQQALASAMASDPNRPAVTSGSSTSLDNASVGFSVPGGIAGLFELRHGRCFQSRLRAMRRRPARRVHGLALVWTSKGSGGRTTATPGRSFGSQPLYELATMDSTETRGASCSTDDRANERRGSTDRTRAGPLRALDRRRRRALRADARVLCAAGDPHRGNPRRAARSGRSVLRRLRSDLARRHAAGAGRV